MNKLTLLKNNKDWLKYHNNYCKKFENLPEMDLSHCPPHEFPCFIFSYSKSDNMGISFRHIFIFKKDVSKLLEN